MAQQMTISWYPGHMHKARRDLKKILGSSDVVIELLDARAPAASSNPLLADLSERLPRIRILTKCDLADEAVTRRWCDFLDRPNAARCLISGADAPVDRDSLLAAASALTGSEQKRRQLVIVGIPNVGKSTLLNSLAGRKLAKTGNEPALTRSQQRIRLAPDWFLVDTPGMLWPRLDDQLAARRLALLGTIRNTALDPADVGWYAAELLLADFRSSLTRRYALDDSVRNPEQLLEHIARQRGTLARGGAPDWHRTAEALLNDFRSGKLGRISLELPALEA